MYRMALVCFRPLALEQAGELLWQLLLTLAKHHPAAGTLIAIDEPLSAEPIALYPDATACTSLLQAGMIDWPEDARSPLDPTHELWLQDRFGGNAAVTLISGWAAAEDAPLPTLSIELRATFDANPAADGAAADDTTAGETAGSIAKPPAEPPETRARQLFERMAEVLTPDWGFIEPPGWRRRQEVRQERPVVSWRSYLGRHVPIGEHEPPIQCYQLDGGAHWLLPLPMNSALDDKRYAGAIAGANETLRRAAIMAKLSQSGDAQPAIPAQAAPAPSRLAPSRLAPNPSFAATAPAAPRHMSPVTPFESPRAAEPRAAEPTSVRDLAPHPQLGGTRFGDELSAAGQATPFEAAMAAAAAAAAAKAGQAVAAPAPSSTRSPATASAATAATPFEAVAARVDRAAPGGAAPASGRSQLEPHPQLGSTRIASPDDAASVTPFERQPASARSLPSTPPELTLEQYASLMAECAEYPDRTVDIRRKYGIADLTAQSRLDGIFHQRFARSATEQGTFLGLVVRYRQWFADQRSKRR